LTLSEVFSRRLLVILGTNTVIHGPKSIRSPLTVPDMPSPAFVRERIGVVQVTLKTA
jgi:hypothetical protein